MLHIVDSTAPERTKYEEIWSYPEYKVFSPGLENVERFIEVLEPIAMASLIDIGCGSGCAGMKFANLGFRVTWLDLTDAALDEQIDRTRFIQAALWDNWGINNKRGWDYGFCCDVMEHLPPEYTMLALDRIFKACGTTWLQIALHDDGFGKFIGKPLHLTVQSFAWWRDRIATLGTLTEARDLCGTGLYVVHR
jgi:2-polyprenyl-3-methyl-5-hydroxy-6-metoxy-1,4-benzoquinol methylase